MEIRSSFSVSLLQNPSLKTRLVSNIQPCVVKHSDSRSPPPAAVLRKKTYGKKSHGLYVHPIFVPCYFSFPACLLRSSPWHSSHSCGFLVNLERNGFLSPVPSASPFLTMGIRTLQSQLKALVAMPRWKKTKPIEEATKKSQSQWWSLSELKKSFQSKKNKLPQLFINHTQSGQRPPFRWF